jgi:hypothetical protein
VPKEKKTLITRQRFERTVIRQHKSRGEDLSCAACGKESEMLPIEQSGLACGIGVRDVFRLLENGQVHFAETPSGLIFICVASLQAEIQKPKQ